MLAASSRSSTKGGSGTIMMASTPKTPSASTASEFRRSAPMP